MCKTGKLLPTILRGTVWQCEDREINWKLLSGKEWKLNGETCPRNRIFSPFRARPSVPPSPSLLRRATEKESVAKKRPPLEISTACQLAQCFAPSGVLR